MNEDKKRISDFIRTLDSYGFSKTVDKAGGYSLDGDLYYRKIGNNKYLVFNHFYKKGKAVNQGFDCSISTYNSENEIGTKEAIQRESVQLSFQIERDWPLIEQYL